MNRKEKKPLGKAGMLKDVRANPLSMSVAELMRRINSSGGKRKQVTLTNRNQANVSGSGGREKQVDATRVASAKERELTWR
jgi:hypothetical protein